MALQKITFTNSNVTAQNDSDFYYFLTGKTGVLRGVKEELKVSKAANKLTFRSGYIAIYGRIIFIEDETQVTVPLDNTAYGYVIVSVNMINNKVELICKEAEASYPSLTKEDISKGMGLYEFPIAKYSKTSINLTLDDSFNPDFIEPKASSYYGENNKGKVVVVGSNGYLEVIAQSQLIAGRAIADESGNNITSTYETKTDATAKLQEAKNDATAKANQAEANANAHTDEEISNIKEAKFTKEVLCDHEYEITGQTGEEFNLAIPEETIVRIDRVEGRTRASANKYTLANNVDLDAAAYMVNGVSMFLPKGTYVGLLSGKEYADGAQYSVTLFRKDGSQITYGNNDINAGISLKIDEDAFSISIYVNRSAKNLQFMLNEGTQSLPFEPYYKGLKSAKADVISTNQNLWDEEWEVGDISNDGTNDDINHPNRIRSKNYIPVKPNCQYSLDRGTKYFYDINKNYISSIYGNPITTPENCYYVRFATDDAWNGTYSEKIMVNYGPTGLPYKPHIEDKYNIGIELGAWDYIDNIKNENVSQTSPKLFLNGTRGWLKGETSNPSISRFVLFGLFDNAVDSNATINVASTYIDKTANQTYNGEAGIHVKGNEIGVVVEGINDVEAFKQWLQTNPITLVYALKTPTVRPFFLPAGYKVWNGGVQQQVIDDMHIPYSLRKSYAINVKAQVDANTDINVDQQAQIDELKGNITNLSNNKVEKEDGKGLSTNDFTTPFKEKLVGVEDGANRYVLPPDVVKDNSYVHTDNNFTTPLKEKYDSYESTIKNKVEQTVYDAKIKELEGRLNDMGFKERSATYNSSLSTPKENSLKKYGKLVMFNFGFSRNTTTKGEIYIPEGFRPKVNTSFLAGFLTDAIPHMIASELIVTVEGKITISQGNASVKIANVCWEAN